MLRQQRLYVFIYITCSRRVFGWMHVAPDKYLEPGEVFQTTPALYIWLSFQRFSPQRFWALRAPTTWTYCKLYFAAKASAGFPEKIQVTLARNPMCLFFLLCMHHAVYRYVISWCHPNFSQNIYFACQNSVLFKGGSSMIRNKYRW